ncbi:MAG: DUF4342 domain-containing protein [Chloroflexota bacterium]
MTNQKPKNDTVNDLVDNGRDFLREANRRYVVIRNQDGSTIADLRMPIVAMIIFAMIAFQPMGTFLAVGAIVYGLVRKVKIDLVSEVKSSDDAVIEVKLPDEQ